MYAVIRSGSKQYRVAPGDTVKVETLPGKVGGKITFEDVLAVGTDEKQLLTGPDAAKAKVVGKIIAQGRHPKITVLKFKTCGQYKISRGHPDSPAGHAPQARPQCGPRQGRHPFRAHQWGGAVSRQGPGRPLHQRPTAGAGRGSPRAFIASGIGKARARGCLSGLAEY